MIDSGRKWLIKIALSFILLSLILNIEKSYAMLNKAQDTIEKVWIIRNDKPNSPWHTKVVPVFLDFTSGKNLVTIRGYNNNSQVTCNYQIRDNYMLINDVKFRIVSLSINNLVLQIGEDYYSYYTLDNQLLIRDKLEVLDLLANNKEWKIGSDTIRFTKETESSAFITAPTFYSLISIKNNRKFYGNFYIDSYKGHIFLYYLIDGQFVENFLEVLDIDNISIKYKKTGQDNIAIATLIN
jgi:hypothetical protein